MDRLTASTVVGTTTAMPITLKLIQLFQLLKNYDLVSAATGETILTDLRRQMSLIQVDQEKAVEFRIENEFAGDAEIHSLC